MRGQNIPTKFQFSEISDRRGDASTDIRPRRGSQLYNPIIIRLNPICPALLHQRFATPPLSLPRPFLCDPIRLRPALNPTSHRSIYMSISCRCIPCFSRAPPRPPKTHPNSAQKQKRADRRERDEAIRPLAFGEGERGDYRKEEHEEPSLSRL